MITKGSRVASSHLQGRSRGWCALLWVSLLLGFISGCTWEPVAREVQPVLLISGSARVLRLLDAEGRYVLVEVGQGDAARVRILKMESRESCELPMGATVPGFVQPHFAPNLRGPDAVDFLLPVFQREGEKLVLYYSDHRCNMRGPFGDTLDDDLGMLQLRSDSRNLSLARQPDLTMYLVDPWSRTRTKIADNVWAYAEVARSEASGSAQALWLIEDTRLTMRALDGTLLLSLGVDVSEFRQTLRDALRVAYVDSGNLYEAKGPDFVPVLVAENACNPNYDGSSLDLWMPCDERQLVRIDITSGAIRRFEPGVFRAYQTVDVSFEQAFDDPSNPNVWRLYVRPGTTGATPRQLITPRPESAVSVLNRQRIVGRSNDNRFGVWTLTGVFYGAYKGVEVVQTFRDARTNQLLWLMLHGVDPDTSLGNLVVVEQREFEDVVDTVIRNGPDAVADGGVRDDAGDVPPLPGSMLIANKVLKGSYRVFYPQAVRQPVIVALQGEVKRTEALTTGSLYAHLLSADERSHVDEGVQTYELVQAPLAGILYGIPEGPRAGLWFAAL